VLRNAREVVAQTAGVQGIEVLAGARVEHSLSQSGVLPVGPTGAHQKGSMIFPSAVLLAPSRAAVRPLQLPVPLQSRLWRNSLLRPSSISSPFASSL
jgi:hypothetical protein